MENDESSSETNLVIITRRYRLKLFLRLYWRVVLLIVIPLILLPIVFIGYNDAYKCFYVFLVTSSYFVADVMHPAIISLTPVALFTLLGNTGSGFMAEFMIRSSVINALGTMMMIIAIEHCNINRRVALIMLQQFGCSHYRISFMLFFSSMFLSMWVSNTLACGIMMPIVKAVLIELERMGILEMYQTVGKTRQHSTTHEQKTPKPTDFTVFYFLGINYSATIGGIATLTGSDTNEIFKWYFESYFPLGPKIEFPHFMLLNLPGVLLMESLLYLWLNFYFMGMFRAESDIALQIGMSEEESQYIHTLLSTQYDQLGAISFHEAVVGVIIILEIIFDALSARAFGHSHVSSPTIACSLLFFIIPTNLDIIKFFRRRSEYTVDPLPEAPTKACLNWALVKANMLWTVLFVIGASCSVFDSLKASRMTEEFERFLLVFQNWPTPAVILIVIIFCKVLTEFATNSCVAYTVLPAVARMSINLQVNPIYLMTAATISSSLPFCLITGTPSNAMVMSYIHMPNHKMIYSGLGPTVFSIVITWFTVTLWSKTIWTDVTVYPQWAKNNLLVVNMTGYT